MIPTEKVEALIAKGTARPFPSGNGATKPLADEFDVTTDEDADDPGPRRPALNWEDLEAREPPAREWVIPNWLPARHTTLLSGRAGIGKTLLAQCVGTAVAMGSNYIEQLMSRRVLMWAGEDDEDELWRRQVAICAYLGTPLSALKDRFFLHSYMGADITLMAPVFGKLETTPMLEELRTQVADYKAEVVILDNIARLYGGSENERHGVTTYCAAVQGACAPAAVIQIGHPAKAPGSEFSGSTAWEGAVRARLYMSDRPPDAADPDEDDAPIDDTVRYLSRRKANYSPLDIRRFTLADGVPVPDDPVEPATAARCVSGEFAKDIVRRAIQRLAEKQVYGSLSTASPEFLPKLASQYKLLDRLSPAQFGKVMREMILSDEITKAERGKYANRTPKLVLVLK